MDVQQTAEKLYKDLRIGNKLWFAKSQKFVFAQRQNGWAWVCKDQTLISLTSNMQQSGFPSRAAAARYLDAALGLNIEQTGFCRDKQAVYMCKGFDFEVCAAQKGWAVFHFNHGFVTDKQNKAFHAPTRFEALVYTLKYHPEFLS